MPGVLFKDGVLPINMLRPAGIRILAALDATARLLLGDLIVTCADGSHPAADPHTLGEAFDVRTHGYTLAHKLEILQSVMRELTNVGDASDGPIETSGGLATLHFYGWLENKGQPDEHLHFQRRKGTVYA